MRLKVCFFVWSALFALSPVYGGADIGVLLHPSDSHSRLVVKQMQVELGRTLRGAGAVLSWLDETAAAQPFEGRRITVTLLGECVGDLLDGSNRGPLGWTKIEDGRVLPYVEIDCNRVRAEIAPDVLDADAVGREVSLGRALGRVLAHELAHVMRRDRGHSGGLTKPALSSRDLLLGSLRLSAADLQPPPIRRPEQPRRRPASTPIPAETDGR